MRARNIKPGLWKDEELAALPLEARYLFPGLWCLADAKGRLEDRPRWIKSEIFPYDDEIGAAKVHVLLQALHDSGFIQRYEVGLGHFIQVTNFEKHQNPHKQEKAKGSQIPPFLMVEPHQKKADAVPIKADAVPVSTGVTPDDYGLRITDTGLMNAEDGHTDSPVCVRQMLKRKEGTPSDRFPEWILGFRGRNTNEVAAARAWAAYVTVETELAAFACRERYNESDDVSRGVLMDAQRFIKDQSENGWKGIWPKARDSPQKAKKSFVNDVDRVIGERLARGEKPWA